MADVRKLGKAFIALAIALIVNAMIPVAHADEKPSATQTALSNTTFGGGDIPLYLGPSDSDGSSEMTVGNIDDTAAPSVSFSLSSVPEPSSIALFMIGVLASVAIANCKRRTSRR